MKLRTSTSADTDILFDIWHRAVLATHDFVSKADLDIFTRVVREDYLPSVELLVAVDASDRPLGFMGMTDANIDSLFIDPDRHGQGLGRMLVESAQARFAGLTVDVNEQNEQAVGFYRRLGFRVLSRSPVDDTGKPYPLLTLGWP